MSAQRSLLHISVLTLLTALIFVSCSSSSAINDFFGIEMSLIDSADFKIVSYTVEDGIKFSSNALMENRVFAWAELGDRTIQITITNNSPKPIPSNYVEDDFVITMLDGKKYSLNKGKNFEYPTQGEIEQNKVVSFTLGLPENFWETISMTNWDAEASNLAPQFWKGQNKYNLHKDNFKNITVSLGGKIYILMKPVP